MSTKLGAQQTTIYKLTGCKTKWSHVLAHFIFLCNGNDGYWPNFTLELRRNIMENSRTRAVKERRESRQVDRVANALIVRRSQEVVRRTADVEEARRVDDEVLAVGESRSSDGLPFVLRCRIGVSATSQRAVYREILVHSSCPHVPRTVCNKLIIDRSIVQSINQ